MRLVVNTNILISALLSANSLPAHLIDLWREGRFHLVTATEQLEEFTRVTRYPKLRCRLAPQLAGRLIKEPRDLAVVVGGFPTIAVSPDPNDDYLLALADAADAEFLITGNKRDLLLLKIYRGTKIVTVREFLTLSRRLP